MVCIKYLQLVSWAALTPPVRLTFDEFHEWWGGRGDGSAEYLTRIPWYASSIYNLSVG